MTAAMRVRGQMGGAVVALWLLGMTVGCGRQIPGLADCPQGQISIMRDNDTIRDIPVASEIDEIPEYHDCQRFRDGGGRYGPLVAIWAATELDRHFMSAPTTGGTDGIPVAEIFNDGQGAYDDLRLKEGFSCLYLRRGPGVTDWQAKMVPLGQSPGPCREAKEFDALGGHELYVHPRPVPEGLTAADIPAVARWDFDSVNMRQYIGLRCGGQWCEIGNRSMTSSVDYTMNPASGNEREREVSAKIGEFPSALPNIELLRQRVVEVKGWYDEQRLALGSGATLTTTEVWGTAFPAPGLGDVTDADFAAGWVLSAYVHMTAQYNGKVPFAQGVSTVSLCKGTVCGVTGLTCATTGPPVDPEQQWWAKIEAPDGTPMFRCINRMLHDGVIPAAAVRWRWTEFDETLWVRCTAGCCTVN